MTNIFIVRLWQRSRLLAAVMAALGAVVVIAGAAGLAFGYRPTPNQDLIYGTLVGFILGLGFAAQVLTEQRSSS